MSGVDGFSRSRSAIARPGMAFCQWFVLAALLSAAGRQQQVGAQGTVEPDYCTIDLALPSVVRRAAFQTSLPPGKLFAVSPGARCDNIGPHGVCWDGYDCKRQEDGTSICEESTVPNYQPGCTNKVANHEQCGEGEGMAPDTCCNKGFICTPDTTDTSSNPRWVCEPSPVALDNTVAFRKVQLELRAALPAAAAKGAPSKGRRMLGAVEQLEVSHSLFHTANATAVVADSNGSSHGTFVPEPEQLSTPADETTPVESVSSGESPSFPQSEVASTAATASQEATPEVPSSQQRRLQQTTCPTEVVCTLESHFTWSGTTPDTSPCSPVRYALGNLDAVLPRLELKKDPTNTFMQLVAKGTSTPVKVTGINWFGFNTNIGWPHGYTGDTGSGANKKAVAMDVTHVLYRLRLLGFNAIRIPFRFLILAQKESTDIKIPCSVTGYTEHFNSNTDPAVWASLTAAGMRSFAELTTWCPLDPVLSENKTATCNYYVPQNNKQTGVSWVTVEKRFLWFLQLVISKGFYAIIDQHSETTDTEHTGTGIGLKTKWRDIWTKIRALPTYTKYIQGRIFLDLANELDKSKMLWDQPLKNTRGAITYPRYDDLMLETIAGINTVNPLDKPLLLVEGVGQLNMGLCMNWGDGFVTQDTFVQTATTSYTYSPGLQPLGGPNRFFQNSTVSEFQVIISPHLYCKSVTTVQCAAGEYMQRYYASFGSKSIAPGVANKVFAVLLGEFGADVDATGNWLSTDKECMDTLATYVANTAWSYTGTYATLGSLPNRGPMVGWAWWDYNANSGDTGGIVKNDWYTVVWPKISYLKDAGFGLKPWWVA